MVSQDEQDHPLHLGLLRLGQPHPETRPGRRCRRGNPGLRATYLRGCSYPPDGQGDRLPGQQLREVARAEPTPLDEVPGKRVHRQTGPGIQIADPSAADDLLDLALEAGQEQRRPLFFCSCALPRNEGQTACHRDTVADLVLKAAQGRKEAVAVIEWPGGGATADRSRHVSASPKIGHPGAPQNRPL